MHHIQESKIQISSHDRIIIITKNSWFPNHLRNVLSDSSKDSAQWKSGC